jgi:peptidyl-tRNA hydrolase
MEKLFVIVRNDLEPGLQVAQAVHAAVKYALSHEDARRWHKESNNVAVLQVPDEGALKALTQRVLARNPCCLSAIFEEPDLEHQWTAAAFGDGARKLLGSLPLALRVSDLLLDESCAVAREGSGDGGIESNERDLS